ncbi:hypothetical protein SUGI_1185750 [Cryptomeria japonica]|uniref:uncharacterized protein LOC131072900 n=1 Tax=Cryptomeria japonica TaxID=3369 RepID=UPI002414B141|nr:uncharacterized protein LOC131072900 [Cryptomeria japonica]GLJ55254.1 hypothetical protein SUGI_1185750 [Cryptomeria japonica]
MEAHKSGKGRVVSQNNYRRRYQIRNRTCYGCGKLGHFVRDCPTKRRNNGAQFKPKNQQKNYVNQRPVKGIWTDGSMRSNFKQENKCRHEISRKNSASNLHEGFSSRPSDLSEDYSSSTLDSSEDNSSSASDFFEHNSSSDLPYDFSENYSPLASDFFEYYSSSNFSEDFSQDYSSSASDLSEDCYSSGSDFSGDYSSSDLSEDCYSSGSDFSGDYSSSDLSKDCYSSGSDFSGDYSSSDLSEDFSQDYSSDSLEDYSFAAYGNQFEDYLSSASESSSALHSSEIYSSSVSDSSQFSSSSASYSSIVYSSSDTDNSEDQDINEFRECEEIQPLQCATSSITQKTSDECLQFPIGTGVESLSQIIGQVSKQSLDSAECHKAVQTMHNLSMLLLINSSFSDNLSESDLQTLQSVICNLSQCLMKSRGVSNSTEVSAFMTDKQLVAANSGETKKDCHAPEEKEDPVGNISFQMSAEVYQSQMVNIEVELNLIKSEISCLRRELEIEGLNKTHAGTHENGDNETLANRNDVNNGSCAEVNLVIKENDFDYTSAPVSQEGSNYLPDLNLNPNMDDGLYIGEIYIKKYTDDVISKSNISEEPIHKNSLNTTAHNPGQPNTEAETKQIEDQFRVLQEPRSCSESDIEYMRDYTSNTVLEDDAMSESPTKIGCSIYGHELENDDVMHTLDEKPFFESYFK